MARMRLTVDVGGYVKLTYHDTYSDEPLSRVFICPAEGGYVREWRRGDLTQVCDRLARMGPTLRCSSRADLPALIRREYRAMRRRDARATA
jgi:hypothetical protein